MDGTGYSIIYSTAGSADEAGRLSEGLVKKQKAACVQLLPVKSVYRWKGSIERAEETLLIVKTRSGLVNDVIEWIKSHHSYETPEIVAVDIAGGSTGYLDWIGMETERKEL